METVQKAVGDAADGLRNLAFGEQTVTESAAQHGEEPVSGVQGRGTPTDPYDAGNRDEQPGAPQTKDNTAVIPEPLESITPIEVKPTDVSSAHSTSDQAPAPGAGTATAATLPVAPAPSSASHSQPETNPNLEPGPGNPAVDQPSPAQEQSNPTASSADTTTSTADTPTTTASSSSNNPSEPSKPAPEQRDQSQTMPKGEDKKEDGGVPGGIETGPSTSQNASVEALKGPQGPAPRDAYEFEKEMDGQPSQTKSDEDAGDKGDSGGHHHKMGHMKERLGKVFKHGNHSE